MEEVEVGTIATNPRSGGLWSGVELIPVTQSRHLSQGDDFGSGGEVLWLGSLGE